MATAHVAVRLEPLVALLAAGDAHKELDAGAGGGRGAGRRRRSPTPVTPLGELDAPGLADDAHEGEDTIGNDHHHLDAAGGPWPCSRLAPRRGELALRRARFVSDVP